MNHDTNDPTLAGASYAFYAPDDGYGGLSYPPATHMAYHHLQTPQARKYETVFLVQLLICKQKKMI